MRGKAIYQRFLQSVLDLGWQMRDHPCRRISHSAHSLTLIEANRAANINGFGFVFCKIWSSLENRREGGTVALSLFTTLSLNIPIPIPFVLDSKECINQSSRLVPRSRGY